MIFASNVFLFIFLPFVLFVYYVPLRRTNHRNILLLMASLFFYAWGEPSFVIIMIASIFANHLFALWARGYKGVSKFQVGAAMTGMVVFNTGLLFVFKYAPVFFEEFNIPLLSSSGDQQIRIPVGISFFTLKAISYVIDVYRGNGTFRKNPLDAGLYISLFPQLVAGPIDRYETISEQLQSRKETIDGFSSGVCRFTVGLAKKILLANTLAIVADKAFAVKTPEALSVSMAWLGAIAFMLQIYYEFSGYSDMAIGLGKMFGFRFQENFNYPYAARSVTDFWNRWHISLLSWFREYVYLPLGGTGATSKKRDAVNLLIVWGLIGIWHGAGWNFILWGLFFYTLLCYEKFFTPRIGIKLPQALGRICAMLCVMLGWVLFRASDLKSAGDYISSMLGLAGNKLTDMSAGLFFRENVVFFAFAILFAAPVAPLLSAKLKALKYGRVVMNIVCPLLYIAVLLVCISYLAKGTYNPFIL